MELGPIASHELWDETLDTITHMVRQHQTTLVFCNTGKDGRKSFPPTIRSAWTGFPLYRITVVFLEPPDKGGGKTKGRSNTGMCCHRKLLNWA
ncbi:MAG: hypothetical protein CM1200mP35_01810 [Chloroflexota bacterium]|nr:MAG: hypothetical protein CM1200mP35_01810 [Chloroflexota bacterium]